MSEKKLPPGHYIDKGGAHRKPSLKQIKFAREYVSNGGNATRAAIDAGYSAHTAHVIGPESLEKPSVQELIEEFKSQVLKAAKITPEIIAAMLMEEAVGKEDSSSNSRIQAMRILTDFVGAFDKNKQKVEHSGGIDLSDKSDDELKQILEGD